MVVLYDQHGRQISARQIRQYAAAKTTRLTGGWNPVNHTVNQVIGSSVQVVRSRIRQLVRDFPYFARAVNVLVNFTVGSGITFQSRVKNPDGKLNKALCQQIEDAFNFWADEADVSGKLHFYELMQLAKRQDVEPGEFLLVKVNSSVRNRFCPFALQVFEADWLTTLNDNYFGGGIKPADGSGNIIRQGIEYERLSGRPVAYHFLDPEGWGGKTVKIPAENVIHGFQTLRPGQLRGISPFAPAVLVAHDLNDFMDAEMDGAKMAAKWLAFVETPDPMGWQNVRAEDNQQIPGQKIEEIENALIEYLRPGEKVNLASHNRPGDNFDPFTRLILRMVGITAGISYELLSGDYSGLNYAVLRGIRNDLAREFDPIQQRHIRQFCNPILRSALDSMVLSGRLPIPDYFRNPFFYRRAQWMPPGMAPVDPLKEGRADADARKSLLKSPQEIVGARGRDYEEVLDEIAMARDMERERNLAPEEISKSTATNPEKLSDENETSSDTQ